MKFAKLFLAATLAVLPATMPSAAFAQAQCAAVFKIVQGASTRTDLLDFVKSRKVPAVVVPSRNGEIPVVLMNAQTGPAMAEFLKNSIGTEVAFQPNYKNDHGLFRLQETVADMDAPGYRQRGEIHGTGISWVDVQSYLRLRSGSTRVEVAYALTPAELRTAKLYQLMRRGAILRVRFAFGDFKQNENLPNFLRNGGEHCFIFCSAGGLPSQIAEVRQRFENSGLGSFDKMIAEPSVREWLGQVEEKLLSVDPSNANALHPQLPIKVGVPKIIAENAVFKNMNADQQYETLNWLVGGDLSIAYQKLTNELGFPYTGNGFNGMNNKRATAVFIYDGQVSPQEFAATTFERKGVFSTWTQPGARPVIAEVERPAAAEPARAAVAEPRIVRPVPQAVEQGERARPIALEPAPKQGFFKRLLDAVFGG